MEIPVRSSKNFEPFSPGFAYWNQRQTLSSAANRLTALFDAVDHKSDLFLSQWAQLFAACLEFKPDLIIELGRGRGNSTCVFTEAVNHLGAEKRSVISLCLSDDWDKMIRDRVACVVEPAWFRPLKALKTNILTYPYSEAISKASRCLVFWDAHGFDVAECVLGGILPCLAGKEHLVIMHDLSDASNLKPENSYYQNHGLWKGNNWSGPRLRLGKIDTAVEQAVAIVDFCSRNNLELHSADQSLRKEIAEKPQRLADMKTALPTEMFSLAAHWFYFSLCEKKEGVLTFPAYIPPAENSQVQNPSPLSPSSNSAESSCCCQKALGGLKTFLKKFLWI